MSRYLLDTNTVSMFVKGHPAVDHHVVQVPITSLGVSAITAGELLFGLARRPDATNLNWTVREFLRRVDVLPWEQAVAERYGVLRATMQRQGNVLGSLDLLIAAHALTEEAVLVTNDQAFMRVAGLQTEDWTR